MTGVVICSIARTPIGKFRGSLSTLTGPQLASIAINGAIVKLHDFDLPTLREAYLGNVVSAGIGQAPCRQAVMGCGLPSSTICTTINKVCSSGMKSVMLACQSLQVTHTKNPGFAMLAGGFESMSNIPRYIPNSRNGYALGHMQLIDGAIFDGLWDPYSNQHMGMCGEKCAKDYKISREEQDEYATESYKRARAALDSDFFTELVSVECPPERKGKETLTVTKDEEPYVINLAKLPTLRPAFDANGSITAANASPLSDGAVALVLMTSEDAQDRGIKPLARILGYGDAEQNPSDFTTTPSLAVPVALANAGLSLSDVEYHEINEAFSVVALANMKILGLQHDRVNIFGGAIALGHPIGMSGARIIGTLYNVLREKNASIGCASICNGGGGASAIVIERLM